PPPERHSRRPRQPRAADRRHRLGAADSDRADDVGSPRLLASPHTMTSAGPSETKRQLVHISMGGFALLLRWLSWEQALALAAMALLFNLFALPRSAHALYRPGDRGRAVHGIVFYPLAVLILIACFPRRPEIAAAAWGILAAGDGVATLAGRAIGGA